MKNGINLFGEEFENIRKQCLEDENELRLEQEKLLNLMEKVAKKNRQRAAKINMIRLSKIEEINFEIKKCEEKLELSTNLSELDNLKKELEYLKYLKEQICEFFGHDVVLNTNGWKCNCCGKNISLIDVFSKTTKYMNITNFNQDDAIDCQIKFRDYLIPTPRYADSKLDSFDTYQEKLIKK